MLNLKIRYVLAIILVMSSLQHVYADDSIEITFSSLLKGIVFDGKWSSTTEWKPTSLNTLSFTDGTIIQLRSAHQDNFIYIFADVISDTHLDKGEDKAMICFDGNNDKTLLPNTDDYCFLVILDQKENFVYQGETQLGFTNKEKIQYANDVIGVGTVSDNNDRYSKVPHTGYEFRIPTDLVGRSNNYGFYLVVYDAYSDKFYSWPQDVKMDKSLQVPSPSLWGNLVSPDKSLPEFQWPILALLPAFLFMILLGNKYLNNRKNIKLSDK